MSTSLPPPPPSSTRRVADDSRRRLPTFPPSRRGEEIVSSRRLLTRRPRAARVAARATDRAAQIARAVYPYKARRRSSPRRAKRGALLTRSPFEPGASELDGRSERRFASDVSIVPSAVVAAKGRVALRRPRDRVEASYAVYRADAALQIWVAPGFLLYANSRVSEGDSARPPVLFLFISSQIFFSQRSTFIGGPRGRSGFFRRIIFYFEKERVGANSTPRPTAKSRLEQKSRYDEIASALRNPL